VKRCLVLYLALLAFLTGSIYADNEWQLVRDADGIRTYIRIGQSSPFVTCRVVCDLDAPLEAIREMLLDTSTTTQWYHHCKECRVLWRDKDNREFLFYFVFKGIWPVADRDLVASLHITKSDSDVFICHTEALKENSETFVPLNKKYVRVTDSASTFTLSRIGKDRTQLLVESTTDPSGMVPVFVVNRYMAYVPFQTLRNMREFLNSSDRYYKMAGIPRDM
jgi:hypothetical protein